MTEDRELREAVQTAEDCKGGLEFYERDKPEYVQAISLLQALAERYLQVEEMLPEKREIIPYRIEDYDGTPEDEYSDGYEAGHNSGYNQAIDDCQLAYTKQMMERLEGLNKLLYVELVNGVNGITPEYIESLATAISNHITNVSKAIGEEE